MSDIDGTLRGGLITEEKAAERAWPDAADISAQEMEKIFDGSLLNAEIIVGKGNALSTSTYEKQ
jgi:hypothetical protein